MATEYEISTVLPRRPCSLKVQLLCCVVILIAIMTIVCYFSFTYVYSVSRMVYRPDSTRNTIHCRTKCNKNWQSPKYYTCRDHVDSAKFSPLERLVHLDLKGAPPKMSYYNELFPLFHKMGATGIVLEYEDMFPYNDKLEALSADTAYTRSDINELVRLAKKNGLSTIIPLVQTFGHMGFVLKHDKFAHLREDASKINAISPALNESFDVIKEMIKQVSRFHGHSKYFHIGSDEVYGMGSGESREFMNDRGFEKDDLLIWHVKRVAQYVKSLGYIPLMWDDMFHDVTVDLLKASGLPSLVEIVVWKYTPNPQDYLHPSLWSKYEQVFPRAWIASGFKGGNEIKDYIVTLNDRIMNHLKWIDIMKSYGTVGEGKLVFQGAILTGWQRFFHIAPLCELLPAGLPALGFTLQILKHGCFSEDMHRDLSLSVLLCDVPIAIDLHQELKSPSVCDFPGFNVYRDIQTFHCIRDSNIDCHRSLVVNASRIKVDMRKHLSGIYFDNTVEEWLRDHF